MSTDKSQLAARAVIAIYREFEQIARRSDISLAQYRLLLFLRNGPKRAGAIAAAAALAKPTVSLAIGGLRDKGWVETGDHADGRASVVVITAAGHRRMTLFEQELAGTMATMIDAEDFGTLSTSLSEAYVAMEVTREKRMSTVTALID